LHDACEKPPAQVPSRAQFHVSAWHARDQAREPANISVNSTDPAPLWQPGRRGQGAHRRETIMLKWALFFFVISIVAGLFGFTGISVAAASIARILFFIFLVIFLVFLVLALMAGRAVT
jgi:uncharacterized membrane protein YtjA (UPF0391 family)